MKPILLSFLFCCLMTSCSKCKHDATSNPAGNTPSTLIMVNEAASKVSPDVKAKFERLFDEWHTVYKTKPEIRLSSRYVYPNTLPQYDELVAMGESIIPLVVEKMSGNDYYFSRLVYEGIRPTEKIHDSNTLGRERANYYIRLWTENHIHTINNYHL